MSISRLRQFDVPSGLAQLSRSLTPESIRPIMTGANRLAREALVRLWLTEGIPEGFGDCPAVYETMRHWLAGELATSPKNITLVGSARTGFSMSPPPAFGRPFGDHSDLDLAIVCPELFEAVAKAFHLFADDFASGTTVPRNDRQRAFWPENVAFGNRNIPKGFVDPNKIPSLDRYAPVPRILNTMWLLSERLQLTPGAPAVKAASVRVYRDWQDLIARVSLSLWASLRPRSN